MTDDTFEKMEEEKKHLQKIIAERVNWDNEPTAKEAWALMIYKCDECQNKEWVWNARPHVTPFGGIPCEICGAFMTHAYFGSDKVAPEHEPKTGDLVFIDFPPELALIYAKRRIRQAEAAGHPIPEDKTFDEFARELALTDLSDFGGHPPYCLRLKS